LHQGPRELRARADFANAAGGGAADASAKDAYMFHAGPLARREHASEGTVRTKGLVGTAAAVELIGA
jgi:hypothetical protein